MSTVQINDLEFEVQKVATEHLYLDDAGRGATTSYTALDGSTSLTSTAINASKIPLATATRTFLTNGNTSNPSAITNIEEALQRILFLNGSSTNNLVSRATSGRPSSPVAGDVAWNSTVARFEGYDGSGWRFLDTRRAEKNLSSSQSNFGQSDFGSSFNYHPSDILVYINGVLLADSDITDGSLTNGLASSFTLGATANNGDNIIVVF